MPRPPSLGLPLPPGPGGTRDAAALAACSAVTFVLFGATYAFAALFPAVSAEFDAGRGAGSVAFSLAGFLTYALGAVSGPLADRLGAARLVAAGLVLAAVSLLLASRAGNLLAVHLAFGIGLGVGAGVAFVPNAAAAQARTPGNPALGAGIAAAGTAAGTLVLPQVACWIVRGPGWRTACASLAALLLAVCLAAVPALRRPPPAARPMEGAAHADGAAAGAPWRLGGALAQARRSPAFRLVYLGAVCAATAAFVPFLHLPAFARDSGLDDARAVALVGWIGLGGLAGRLGFGAVSGRFGHRACFAAAAAGMAASLLWWWAAPAAAAAGWGLPLAALGFGVFFGGYVVLLPVLAQACLPGPNPAGAIGLMLTSSGVGLLVDPVAAGAVHDATGGYGPAILAAAALYLVTIACALRVRLPPPFGGRGPAVRPRPATGGADKRRTRAWLPS